MQLEQLTIIGQIKRAHGVHGELKVHIEPFYSNQIELLQAFIIQKGDEFLPFFIEDINDTLTVLKLEDVESKEEAITLLGKNIYALTSQLKQVEVKNKGQFDSLKVYNHDNEYVGKVEEVIEMPQQLLLRVLNNETEYLLPLHEDLIISIDEEQIQLEIPEGLLDIFQ